MPRALESVPRRIGTVRPSAVLPGLREMSLRARLAAIAVLCLATFFGWLALRGSSLFAVDHVTIEGLSVPTRPAVAEALISAARGQTTTDFSVAPVRAAVASDTVIASVRARTSFPHGVTLIVSVRPVVARLEVGRETFPVAADGVVISGARTAHLATVRSTANPVDGRTRDAFALVALRVLGDAPAPLRRRVVTVTRAAGLTVYLHAGPRLIFGNAALPHAKWDAAAAVLGTPSSRGSTYIDLTVPSRPAAQVGDPATSTSVADASTTASATSTLATAELQQ